MLVDVFGGTLRVAMLHGLDGSSHTELELGDEPLVPLLEILERAGLSCDRVDPSKQARPQSVVEPYARAQGFQDSLEGNSQLHGAKLHSVGRVARHCLEEAIETLRERVGRPGDGASQLATQLGKCLA